MKDWTDSIRFDTYDAVKTHLPHCPPVNDPDYPIRVATTNRGYRIFQRWFVGQPIPDRPWQFHSKHGSGLNAIWAYDAFIPHCTYPLNHQMRLVYVPNVFEAPKGRCRIDRQIDGKWQMVDWLEAERLLQLDGICSAAIHLNELRRQLNCK